LLTSRRRLAAVASVLSCLAAPSVASAAPTTSPELVPFTGTRTIGWTWGAPSGGYHSYPAIDVSMPMGTPIYAAGTGTIVASHSGCPVNGSATSTCGMENLGNAIRIAHPDGRHSRYGHLSSLVVGSGNVSAGQLIGYSGNSGKSEGPHLHYQETSGAAFAAAVDPGVWVACHGSARVEYGNLQHRVRQAIRNDGYGCSTGVPVGAFDVAGSPQAGMVSVRGWAFDPDAKTAQIAIHVYVGGTAGAAGAEGHNLGAANTHRPDVGAAYPGVGNHHGYDATFATGKTGNQPVCAYAINTGPGDNVLLGCKTIAIADPSPRGAHDVASSPEGGKVRVRGWAFDPNAPTSPIAIHIYVGGTAGQAAAEGHNIGAAAVRRPDVGKAYPGVGDYHGFDKTFATAKRGSQRVCAYAIDVGPGDNVFIGCKTVTIGEPTAAREQPPPGPPPLGSANVPPACSTLSLDARPEFRRQLAAAVAGLRRQGVRALATGRAELRSLPTCESGTVVARVRHIRRGRKPITLATVRRPVALPDLGAVTVTLDATRAGRARRHRSRLRVRVQIAIVDPAGARLRYSRTVTLRR
jgi:Peptidase family M23